jgi:Protein of unknown function (DUF2752)
MSPPTAPPNPSCSMIGERPSLAAVGIRVGWSDRDQCRHLTRLATFGLALAGLLALVGLPPVDLHGPLHRFGIMDPLCGMTRGVRYVMLGHLGRAIDYNPASPVLVAGAVGAMARAVVGGMSGRWLVVHIRATRPAVMALAAVLAALWVNQQLHASLLMR